ncbi:MAG: hypothetical protein AAF393_09880 [Pseudomonadota bacterium]
MEMHMSPEVLEGLSRARRKAAQTSKRLRVLMNGEVYPVLRSWDNGFAVSAQDTPFLRGTVEMLDGSRVLHECLIVCSEQDGPEIRYEVKRRQSAVDERPLDFVRAADAPVALLEK